MVLEDAITVTEDRAHTIERVAHYKSQKLVDGDTQGFVTECQRYLTGEVRKTINSTILENCKRDRRKGVRFARVPMGTGTCAFCYMLSSKGAVYHSRETAGAQNHWHNDCRCKIVPGFKTDPLAEIVEGYRPDIMQENYREISKACGIDWNNGDFAGNMRKFQRDIQYRDINWLYTGTAPEPKYANKEAYNFKKGKAKSIKKYEETDEFKSIQRLASKGYSSTIIKDRIELPNGDIVGTADLANGIEVKTIRNSNEKTAINTLIESRRKLQTTAFFVDATGNAKIADIDRFSEKAASMLRHSIDSGDKGVYIDALIVLKPDGTIRSIAI